MWVRPAVKAQSPLAHAAHREGLPPLTHMGLSGRHARWGLPCLTLLPFPPFCSTLPKGRKGSCLAGCGRSRVDCVPLLLLLRTHCRLDLRCYCRTRKAAHTRVQCEQQPATSAAKGGGLVSVTSYQHRPCCLRVAVCIIRPGSSSQKTRVARATACLPAGRAGQAVPKKQNGSGTCVSEPAYTWNAATVQKHELRPTRMAMASKSGRLRCQ